MVQGFQQAFGRARFPPGPTRKWFLRDFPDFWDFGVAPLAPLCIPYWPFVGYSPVWGPVPGLLFVLGRFGGYWQAGPHILLNGARVPPP